MKILSIITINYNNFVGLQKTIESISNQSVKEFEHIIIDGGSIDGSINVIKSYVADYSETYTIKWISERDTGIYNAMNKGIRMAEGRFLLFINSGDILFDGKVIEGVSPFLKESVDLVSGQLQYVSGDEKDMWDPPKTITLDYCVKVGLTHPNTFINRDLFEQYGYYNEENKIVSDWEFFLIVCGLNSAVFVPVLIPIATFYADGISSLQSALCRKEKRKVLNRLLPFDRRFIMSLKGVKRIIGRSISKVAKVFN